MRWPQGCRGCTKWLKCVLWCVASDPKVKPLWRDRLQTTTHGANTIMSISCHKVFKGQNTGVSDDPFTKNPLESQREREGRKRDRERNEEERESISSLWTIKAIRSFQKLLTPIGQCTLN